LWLKCYTLEVGAHQQTILRYWTKYAIFAVSFTVCQFSPSGGRKTPWGDAPSLVSCFRAFIVDENLLFVVDMLSSFEVTRFRLAAAGGSAGARRNLGFCPPNSRGGVKQILHVVFQA